MLKMVCKWFVDSNRISLAVTSDLSSHTVLGEPLLRLSFRSRGSETAPNPEEWLLFLEELKRTAIFQTWKSTYQLYESYDKLI